MMFCDVGSVQVWWRSKARRSPLLLFFLSIAINIGMWFERLVLIVTSQSEGFLPSSWGRFQPSFVDVSLFLGTLAFFAFLMLLVVRFVPFIPLLETKELARERGASIFEGSKR